MKKQILIHIDSDSFPFSVEGAVGYGAQEVLIAKDDNLISALSWRDLGYTVVPFIDEVNFGKLKQGITELLKNIVELRLKVPCEEFSLATYHRYVDSNDKHLKVVGDFRSSLPLTQFPIDPDLVFDRASQLLEIPVGPGKLEPHFGIRVVRPHSHDHNPPHKDVWLDRLRNAVNLYAPLAGSDAKSSLPLIPGSHYWKESEIERTLEGAKGAFLYTVPAVTDAKFPLKFLRPNPKQNEALFFSPYLIHGGGVNLNEDTTRVSLEMRFWRK